MQVKQLEAFRAVILSGSLTNAATWRKVSQPTISRLITDLEQELGFSLFLRQRGKIIPTEDGMLFFSQLEKVNEVLNGLRRTAEDIRRQHSSHLKIAATPALASFVLPRAAAEFGRLAPNTALTIEAKNIPQLIEGVRSGQLDAVFTHSVSDIPGIIQHELCAPEFLCALPAGHPLAARSEVRAEDLVGETVVRLEDPEDFDFTSHETALGQYDWWTHARLQAKQSTVAYSYVRYCGAIAIIEPFSSDLWSAVGVTTRPFRPAIKYSYSVLYPELRKRGSTAELYIKCLRKVLAEMQLA